MKKKRKWKFKRIAIALTILVIIIIGGIKLYIDTTPYGKLRKLDYTKEVIKLMDEDVQTKVIKAAEYSDTLTQALLQKKFNEDNLALYLEIKYKDDKHFIEYMNKLAELKYSDKTIIQVYKELKTTEIGLLVKIGYVKDLDEYLNIGYFRTINLTRYIEYKVASEKEYEAVVTYVNIGLDKDYYDEEFVQTVKDTDDILILVNKYNKFPDKYEPSDLTKISKGCSKETSYLRKEAAVAFESLCKGSIDEGSKVLSLSAYRSYKEQQDTWDDYMNDYGSSYTYYYVAKPGYSEHQTGLALDLASGSNPGEKFSYTKDYTWVINNAYKYGFILRYEEGEERVTGYNFEPWHIRYVGIKTATYIYEHDVTFDEYMATR